MSRFSGSVGLALLLSGAACGGIPRYAVTKDVRESAQRTVVVGAVHCEDLWKRHPLAEVRLELLVEGQESPLATTVSAADGTFQLATSYLDDPRRPGLLRIKGDGWRGEALLAAPIDQTYTVDVQVLCPADHPRGATLLSAAVTVQAAPSPGFDTEPPTTR